MNPLFDAWQGENCEDERILKLIGQISQIKPWGGCGDLTFAQSHVEQIEEIRDGLIKKHEGLASGEMSILGEYLNGVVALERSVEEAREKSARSLASLDCLWKHQAAQAELSGLQIILEDFSNLRKFQQVYLAQMPLSSLVGQWVRLWESPDWKERCHMKGLGLWRRTLLRTFWESLVLSVRMKLAEQWKRDKLKPSDQVELMNLLMRLFCYKPEGQVGSATADCETYIHKFLMHDWRVSCSQGGRTSEVITCLELEGELRALKLKLRHALAFHNGGERSPAELEIWRSGHKAIAQELVRFYACQISTTNSSALFVSRKFLEMMTKLQQEYCQDLEGPLRAQILQSILQEERAVDFQTLWMQADGQVVKAYMQEYCWSKTTTNMLATPTTRGGLECTQIGAKVAELMNQLVQRVCQLSPSLQVSETYVQDILFGEVLVPTMGLLKNAWNNETNPFSDSFLNTAILILNSIALLNSELNILLMNSGEDQSSTYPTLVLEKFHAENCDTEAKLVRLFSEYLLSGLSPRALASDPDHFAEILQRNHLAVIFSRISSESTSSIVVAMLQEIEKTFNAAASRRRQGANSTESTLRCNLNTVRELFTTGSGGQQSALNGRCADVLHRLENSLTADS